MKMKKTVFVALLAASGVASSAEVNYKVLVETVQGGKVVASSSHELATPIGVESKVHTLSSASYIGGCTIQDGKIMLQPSTVTTGMIFGITPMGAPKGDFIKTIVNLEHSELRGMKEYDAMGCKFQQPTTTSESLESQVFIAPGQSTVIGAAQMQDGVRLTLTRK